MLAGQHKKLYFVVDRDDVNYIALSANVAVEGSKGGPDM